MNKRPGYSPEVRERAVRLVLTSEHEHKSCWAAVTSVAGKIGCTPETLRAWVNKSEVDTGVKTSITTDESVRIKALERENRELKRANDTLRLASVFFAQAELDRKKWSPLLMHIEHSLVSSPSAKFCRWHHQRTTDTSSWNTSLISDQIEPRVMKL